MKEVSLALDSGFGDCKICMDFKFSKEISAIAKIESHSELADENFVECDGSKYYVFSEAAKLPKSKQVAITNYEELRFATPIFVKAIERKYDVKVTKLCLGLSIAMIDKSADFKSYVSSKIGLSEDSIKLLPQGIGSKVAYNEYNLDIDDPSKKNDHRSLNYVCMDMGFNTLDIFQVINGKLSTNAIKGFEGKGVIIAARKLHDIIVEKADIECDLPTIKEVLAKGGLNHRGKYYDFSEDIRSIMIEYILSTFKLFESEFSDSIDKMDNVLLVGGGAALLSKLSSDEVDKYLNSNYAPGFLMIPKNPEYYNVLGYYLYLNR